MRESDLRSVFIEIGTPSALGVRRDERERWYWNSTVNTQFWDDFIVEGTYDPMMRICYQ